jgi:hypothetical protein
MREERARQALAYRGLLELHVDLALTEVPEDLERDACVGVVTMLVLLHRDLPGRLQPLTEPHGDLWVELQCWTRQRCVRKI